MFFRRSGQIRKEKTWKKRKPASAGAVRIRILTAQRENAEERKYEDEIKKDLSGPAVGVHGDDHDADDGVCRE